MPLSAEIRNTICERIAAGESLRSICKDGGMPSKAAVFADLAADASFADQYTRAREAQADSLADEIVEIADDSSDDPNSRRIRIDARKWVAGKMRPKKYGDKISAEVTGADGGPVEFAWAPK